MPHIISLLKCSQGHIGDWIITYDSNECGCHHNGKATLSITCRKCFKEKMKDALERKDMVLEKEDISKLQGKDIEVVLDDETNKKIKEWTTL